jgi:hypothetical protein
LAVCIVALVVVGRQPPTTWLILAAALLLVAERLISLRRPMRMPWAVITRLLTAVGVVLLIAVGIKLVQDGRAPHIAHDLVAEARLPVRPPPPIAAAADLPDIYLVLLDGYPRPDKLRSEFGYDDSGFVSAMQARGFFVASHSRSNYPLTRMTLASMFNAEHLDSLYPTGGPGTWEWRRAINEGRVFGGLRDAGYEIVSISSGFEVVSLRQADRFIDTGQLNEFEWVLLQTTGISALLDAIDPTALADDHRARVDSSLDAAASLAETPGGPRLVLLHVLSPHSPLVYGSSGEATDPGPTTSMFDDALDVGRLGWTEYARRLAGQVEYLDSRVLDLVDQVDRAGRPAAMVVFSDHGSGARYDSADPDHSDLDLRTANLLAVRTPGKDGLVDDRSTLINVLPRLMRAYLGEGPADLPETIHVYDDGLTDHGDFQRPD